jgi:hypothetical protein
VYFFDHDTSADKYIHLNEDRIGDEQAFKANYGRLDHEKTFYIRVTRLEENNPLNPKEETGTQRSWMWLTPMTVMAEISRTRCDIVS